MSFDCYNGFMRGHSGSRRRRLLALLGASVAIAAAAGLLAAAASADAAAITINVFYTSPTSIQVSLSDGTPVSSGSAIPAGSYQVLVYDNDDYDANPKFTLSGPGVSVAANNLNSTGMGIDLPSTFGPFTFQTSSSYTVSDPGIGASVTFQTATTSSPAGSGGSSGGGASPGGSSAGGTSSAGSGSAAASSGGASSGGSAGSLKLLGTLAVSVSLAGTPAAVFDGKPVKTLKAGRYTITVADHATKAGLLVGEGSKTPLVLSGAAKVGRSSKTVTLGAGRWFFEPTSHGPKTYFSVVA